MNLLRRILTLACLLAVGVSLSLFELGCKDANTSNSHAPPLRPSIAKSPAAPISDFAGSSSCVDCHEAEAEKWHGSHHDLAMDKATEETVLGDFDNAVVTHFDATCRFFRVGNEYMVNTQDADGTYRDFKVEYVFGVYPLQQVLIPFPDGRYQALQFCWDSRSKDEGGQRWYHLYEGDPVPPGDILHWTGNQFTWNYMCADCHSTGLRKNFDPEKNTYDTKFAEIDVACEACHGPGNDHIDWANTYRPDPDATNRPTALEMGLSVQLKEDVPHAWLIDPESGKPYRNHPLEHDNLIDSCVRCHSHRRLVEGDFVHGGDALDGHKPSLLEPTLYHTDGQIKEEVYVYGSFIQSKMYHEGVRCNDCHDPHSLELRAPGNMLCLSCHSVGDYDTPSHHHHAPDTAGAQCVNCHMPEKVYMGVDGRRDHSFRIPRPDLAVKHGTPDACTLCHSDKTPAWSAAAYQNWWQDPPASDVPHYGETFAAADANLPAAEAQLIQLAKRETRPMIKATALWFLQQLGSSGAVQTIAETGLTDPDPLVREAGIAIFDSRPEREQAKWLVPMLKDPVKAVRVEAARVLADLPRSYLSQDQRKSLDGGIEEFKRQQMAVSDRGGGHMGLALLYADLGDNTAAEAAYRDAFRVEPMHIESRLNLAEMLYQQNRMAEGLKLVQDAVAVQPQNGVAHEALGRWLVRTRDYAGGVNALAEAVRLMPDRHDLNYFLGVGYNQIGRFDDARQALIRAHEQAPAHADYLIGIATVCRDNGDLVTARRYADKLLQLDPNNPGYRQLRGDLR